MNILIIGCGRVGSTLARDLDLAGHEVSIMDENPKHLKSLNNFPDYSFGGMQFVGVPIDTDALSQAGIENMDAVACVTPDDNINLMVYQIATEIYGINRTICRVADPSLKEVFSEHFGVTAVCSTNLTADVVKDVLFNVDTTCSFTLGSSTAGLVLEDINQDLIGKNLSEVPLQKNRGLFGILRANKTIELATIPEPIIRNNDQLIWSEILD